ncbi:hypothetical protein BASA61_002093 [Batrachochytrium salamandrivorans]|nr:hypothetical protein BASA61_002093 [Batrachochytrium salamandrivorans]
MRATYDIYDKERVSSSRVIQALETLVARWSSSSYCLVRSQESGIFMSTKKLTRQTGSLVTGTLRIYFHYYSSPGKLNGRADSLSRREDYFLDGDQSNFQRIIDPIMFWIFKLHGGSRSHVLVHSTVLDKVFVQEADWPLIIADFLAGEDNVWIEEISEDWLELCKKELKNFRFRDNTFVRI